MCVCVCGSWVCFILIVYCIYFRIISLVFSLGCTEILCKNRLKSQLKHHFKNKSDNLFLDLFLVFFPFISIGQCRSDREQSGRERGLRSHSDVKRDAHGQHFLH